MVKRTKPPAPPARAAVTPIDEEITYLSEEEDEDLRENPDYSGAAEDQPHSRTTSALESDASGPPLTIDDAFGPRHDEANAAAAPAALQTALQQESEHELLALGQTLAAQPPNPVPQVSSAAAPQGSAPAPDALVQILLMLQQQQQATAAMQEELREQKRQIKQRDTAHAEEAHLRAVVAQDAAIRGRTMPVGEFVPAPLVHAPQSPASPGSVSRSSQANTNEMMPPSATQVTAARAAELILVREGDVRPSPQIQHLPPPKKARAITPPLPGTATNPVQVNAPKLLALPPKAQAGGGPAAHKPAPAPFIPTPHRQDLTGLRKMPPPLPPFVRLKPVEEQLSELRQMGWNDAEAKEALEAVKDKNNPSNYVAAANQWALGQWPAGPLSQLLRDSAETKRRREEDAETKRKRDEDADAQRKRDEEVSALGHEPSVPCAVEDLLVRHPPARGLLLTCRELHDVGRGQHSSDQLVAVDSIKLAAKRANKSNADSPYLDAVCAAIVSDCESCHRLIQRRAATLAEAATVVANRMTALQQVVLAYPASAGAIDRAAEDEHVTCDKCGIGWVDGESRTKYVRKCETCPLRFHDHCQRFVRANSLTPTPTYVDPLTWMCEACQQQHPHSQSVANRMTQRRERERSPPRPTDPLPSPENPRGGSAGGGTDRRNTGDRRPPPQRDYRDRDRDRADDQGHPTRQYVNHQVASKYRVNSEYYPSQNFDPSVQEPENGSDDMSQRGSPPPPHPPRPSENGSEMKEQKFRAPNKFSLESLSEKLEDLEKKSQPKNGVVHQAEKYQVWDYTHGDKKIADARCGWSKQAWLHHRRHNVPLRDQAIDRGYSMGPMKNALSVEMKRSVKTKLSNSVVISGKRSSMDVATWFKGHPNWFEELEDDIYINAMDEKFQVATPAALFRLRIANNIPAQTEDGYPYYPVKEFGLHSDQWINLLAELQELDHDLSEKSLKDAFIETLRPHKLLFNEANRLGTTEVSVLIATLSDWLTREQQKCTDVQNAVDDLEEETPKKRKEEARRNPPQEQAPESTKRVHSTPGPFKGNQMNQAVKAFLTMYSEANKGEATTGPGFLTGPGTNRDFQCNQCGTWWDSKRPVPCTPNCSYIKHPKFKVRTLPWPKNEPQLSWRGVPYNQIDDETKKRWDADKARKLRSPQGGSGGRPPFTQRGGA